MAKQRISSNVSSELAIQVKDTAKQAGLSVSAFIENAVEGLLGRSCILVENSRLSKDLDQRGDRINELCLEKDRLSRQIACIKSECDTIKSQRQSQLCYLVKALGVEYTIETKKPLDDAYLAKLCDAICAKIEVLTESHDIFKAASEEVPSSWQRAKRRSRRYWDEAGGRGCGIVYRGYLRLIRLTILIPQAKG